MFQKYYDSIKAEYESQNENSEHTFRTHFQNFLREFEQQYSHRNLLIKHEPLNVGNYGRPDFKVTTDYHLTIGLIETKKIGDNLKDVLKSEQIKKYSELSDNIILTDYLDFYLIRNGEVILHSWLFTEFDLDKKKFKVAETNIIQIKELLLEFFSAEPEPIVTVDDLAKKLSRKAIFLREFSKINLAENPDDDNKLYSMYNVFRETLLPGLETDYFSDIYAQTICYGLFLGGLNCDSAKEQLNRFTAFSLMPNSFPLIKELFHNLDDFPTEVVWAIDEILTILKVTDYSAIKHEFAEYRNREQGFHDPFIYFYEDFLKQYDKNQRELRGVYYTPEPVVSYIVRSVEEVLKDTFGMPEGYVNDKVTVLDFACGTGTFLLNVFKQAIGSAHRYGDKGFVNKMLNERLINRYYGFELLVAPYVVAHLKISEYLKEQGYSLWDGKRLSVYLTNTLSNNEPKPFGFMPHLSREGKEANRIKNEDVLVVMGNPPYSGHSANKGAWIDDFMKDYFVVDGKPLNERNPKWLNDDYVKFLRFAQWKMEKLQQGVVGVITNHSYLDNPTFRGMRQSLMNSYDEIYIIDLHGNAKKKEKSPDGSLDQNVFDIQQGVAIAIFVKKQLKPKSCRIFYHDVYGHREAKKAYLNTIVKSTTDWEEINPDTPFYLFRPRNIDLLKKYNKGISLTEIFGKSSVGIVTARDNFTIDFKKDKLWRRINDFVKLNTEEARIRYNLGKDVRDWKVEFAKKDLLDSGLDSNKIINIAYRPFDSRYTYFTGRSRGFHCMPRKDIMLNMQEQNIALISVRQVAETIFNHTFIAKNIIESRMTLSNKGIAYAYPLYIMKNGEEKIFFGVSEPTSEYGELTKSGLVKTENIKPEFRKYIFKTYKRYVDFTPEQILGYIYAVLHSKIYREKYIEFLKIDFPRIPFADSAEIFEKMSELGWELIQHHLLNETTKIGLCKLSGEGSNYLVEKVERAEGKVWFNKERYFEGISDEVWDFHIGGYQVLDKWLKERKKHEVTLETEDILHFISVVDVIDYTIKTMEKIDEIAEEWI
ncbi:MAG: type ISP restriction/modification enzyme [Candidatus Kapabacteria bacterium]|nr:type ISP restriction/modification enzyme [Candidatus Kapabacteria bacterium]